MPKIRPLGQCSTVTAGQIDTWADTRTDRKTCAKSLRSRGGNKHTGISRTQDLVLQGRIQGGGGEPSLTTKNEAPAPKFYKIEAPEWQF